MIVIKVGGSLYNLPDLKRRLSSFLDSLTSQSLLVFPGGGPTADVIRDFDRDHSLGPVSHWLALRACALNAYFLLELLPHARVVGQPGGTTLEILDPHAFAVADEGRTGCLPHEWTATSDSVAARVAEVYQADLILLKSVSIGAEEWVDWEQAARDGHVDPLFPSLVARAKLSVRSVNLREWPDERERPTDRGPQGR